MALAFCAVAEQPKQSTAQVQHQKALADTVTIPEASVEFRTPLKTFETYFASVTDGSAREFRCFTPHGMHEWFGKETLTEASLQIMRTSSAMREEKDHALVEFRYSDAEPNKPRIIFSWSYTYKDTDGRRILTMERQELLLVRTESGWKIDLMNALPEA